MVGRHVSAIGGALLACQNARLAEHDKPSRRLAESAGTASGEIAGVLGAGVCQAVAASAASRLPSVRAVAKKQQRGGGMVRKGDVNDAMLKDGTD